ncbi:hypothetical protein JR334_01965 [Clostridia bacterium]|nr:hypothetical protein JR334_01965 [Clostridia bacterium]
MTKAEISKLLNNHTYVEDEIRECVEEMQLLAEAIDCERGIKATIISGMPGNTSTTSDPTYQKAAKILEEYKKDIDRIEKRQRGIFRKRALVELLLDVLTVEEKKIIELRYFKKYKWWMVASNTHYARRQCFNIRDTAIEKMIKATIEMGI